MPAYRRVLFIVISLFVYLSATANELKRESVPERLAAPVADFNQKVLYKVNIQIYKHVVSGLLFLKKDQDSIHTHVVLLTEVGLTICEYLSDGQTMELKQASSLFQSKAAQGLLAEDFGMLIHPALIKKKKDDRIKSRNKTIYSQDAERKIIQMRKRRIINGIKVDLSNYKEGVPSDIHYKHRGIKFEMNLKLIKVN